VQGRVVRRVDGTLMVAVDGRESGVQIDRILEVRRGPDWGLGSYAGVGALVGVTVGLVAARASAPADARALAGMAYAWFGGLAGGATGLAMGGLVLARPWPLVYQRGRAERHPEPLPGTGGWGVGWQVAF
jgi:hypothetical protein